MRWLATIGRALLGLVLVSLLVLVLLGYREGARRIQGTTEIARPPAEVWPWIVGEDHVKQWVSWLTEVHDLTPGQEGVGARRRWVMIDPTMNNQRVEIDAEYTAFDPPRVSAMRLDSPGMFTGTGTYTLVDLGDGHTRVNYESEFSMVQWIARLFEPLITPQARKKAIQDLARLKELAEAAPRAAVSDTPAVPPER